jgi:hypothetical protein
LRVLGNGAAWFDGRRFVPLQLPVGAADTSWGWNQLLLEGIEAFSRVFGPYRPVRNTRIRSKAGVPGGTALLGLTAKPLKMRWMLRNDQLSCALKCPSRSEQRGRGEPRMLPSWDHHT